MIEKTISFDGYNKAEIIAVMENGDVLCNVSATDENGTITKHDSNILFFADSLPFEITNEELEQLNNNEETNAV